jgi:hypothetical protein
MRESPNERDRESSRHRDFSIRTEQTSDLPCIKHALRRKQKRINSACDNVRAFRKSKRRSHLQATARNAAVEGPRIIRDTDYFSRSAKNAHQMPLRRRSDH